jgi:uncharacterized protein (DUF1778 family)
MLRVRMSIRERAMLKKLAALSGHSESHFVRSWILAMYVEKFGASSALALE